MPALGGGRKKKGMTDHYQGISIIFRHRVIETVLPDKNGPSSRTLRQSVDSLGAHKLSPLDGVQVLVEPHLKSQKVENTTHARMHADGQPRAIEKSEQLKNEKTWQYEESTWPGSLLNRGIRDGSNQTPLRISGGQNMGRCGPSQQTCFRNGVSLVSINNMLVSFALVDVPRFVSRNNKSSEEAIFDSRRVQWQGRTGSTQETHLTENRWLRITVSTW